MKFSISAVLFTLMAVASAEAGMSHLFARQNEGRPVVNGACCVAGQSKRQDFCSVNGAQGKCVPANTAGCGEALTCIQNAQLSCDPNQLDNGRIKCVLAQ